jgi:hypothetical protein
LRTTYWAPLWASVFSPLGFLHCPHFCLFLCSSTAPLFSSALPLFQHYNHFSHWFEVQISCLYIWISVTCPVSFFYLDDLAGKSGDYRPSHTDISPKSIYHSVNTCNSSHRLKNMRTDDKLWCSWVACRAELQRRGEGEVEGAGGGGRTQREVEEGELVAGSCKESHIRVTDPLIGSLDHPAATSPKLESQIMFNTINYTLSNIIVTHLGHILFLQSDMLPGQPPCMEDIFLKNASFSQS